MLFSTENTFVLDDNQSEYTPFAALQLLSPFFDKIPGITETSLWTECFFDLGGNGKN